MKCSSAAKRRKPARIRYEREYRRVERASGKRREYEQAYNRRPEVRERYRMRWHEDPEYRARQYAIRRVPFADVAIPRPYTGHRWFDMAREAVGKDCAPEFEDFGYTDEMGEAVLALLEGRNMHEAVSEFRKHEYIPRYRTTFFGEWTDDPDKQYRMHQAVPRVQSAEDEYIAKQYVQSAFSDVSLRRRRMKHETQQPHRRRMKDGKSWMKHAAS